MFYSKVLKCVKTSIKYKKNYMRKVSQLLLGFPYLILMTFDLCTQRKILLQIYKAQTKSFI